MLTDRTLAIIKPDAFSAGCSGEIISTIEKAKFHIVAAKLIHLTFRNAGKFYSVHKTRIFYTDLCTYMSSGPIIAMILEKENAVNDFRKLIGATDPAKAEEGTIRKRFATSIETNAVHGSDSNESADLESGFFFSKTEEFSRKR